MAASCPVDTRIQGSSIGTPAHMPMELPQHHMKTLVTTSGELHKPKSLQAVEFSSWKSPRKILRKCLAWAEYPQGIGWCCHGNRATDYTHAQRTARTKCL
eukprot:4410529-Amphidinium_carterae.1